MRLIAALAAGVALLIAAPAVAEKGHSGYPSSMILLGHSGGTGYNSDPNRPGIDVRANSWATGTNPAVDSVYQRILALNPAIRGHNLNYAHDGAKIRDVLGQAYSATKLKRKPELVLIQTISNDIDCAGDQSAHLADFRHIFTLTLRTLSRGLPNARIFVTSDYGRPLTYARAVQGIPEAVERDSGSEPCNFFDDLGNIALDHIAFYTGILESYERAEAQLCARYLHCRYDGGAMARGVDEPAYYSSIDWGHPSVAGHAWIAALAWSAMFDFTDATAPVSKASRHGRKVTLSARDDSGVAGIEYKLTARKKKPKKWFKRYAKPLKVKRKWTLVWRAVDVNGNSEATHKLRG